MNTEKNYQLFNIGTALAIGLVLSSIILGWSYTHKKDGNEAVTVTGSAKKRIKSDLVIWSAGVSYQSAQLSDAYKQLSENIPRIKKYLVEKGINENQITVSAISSNTLHGRDENGNETSEITGYNLRQEIVVNSTDVERIALVAREATELINQGILLESSPPKCYYNATRRPESHDARRSGAGRKGASRTDRRQHGQSDRRDSFGANGRDADHGG